MITLLWSEGDRHVPVDYRIYDKAADALSKNDHFRAMLNEAQTRDFVPEGVIFDSGYASLPNLKQIRSFGWCWVTRLECNRQVNPEGHGNQPVNQVALSE